MAEQRRGKGTVHGLIKAKIPVETDAPQEMTPDDELKVAEKEKKAHKLAARKSLQSAPPVRQTSRIRGYNYKVRVTLLEDLLGTVPKNKELYTDYIASKRPVASLEDQPAAMDDELEMVPEQENGDNIGTGFFSDADGVYLINYQFKGFLKEGANNLKDQLDITALKSKIDNFVFVGPRHIYLKDAPDGNFERPLRGMTPTGPRVALARSDFIKKGLSFEVEITMLAHAEITQAVLETILDYGLFKGLGQFRNGGFGTFGWEFI